VTTYDGTALYDGSIAYGVDPYSANGWADRFFSSFPVVWSSDEGVAVGGQFYSFIAALCSAFALVANQAEYVQAQTRITTATEENLDNISTDYFGDGLPRLPSESDDSFRQRIEHALTERNPTIAAIQAACQFYEDYLAAQEPISVSETTLNQTGVTAASVSVYDLMTNPAKSASVGILAGSAAFAVELVYPTSISVGWVIDASFIGYNTYLIDGDSYVQSEPDPNIVATVELYKAEGTRPVYTASLLIQSP